MSPGQRAADMIAETELGPYRTPEARTTPAFLAALLAQGREDLVRVLSPALLTLDVFESVAKDEITPEEGADLLVLKREAERAKDPWYVRLCRWVTS